MAERPTRKPHSVRKQYGAIFGWKNPTHELKDPHGKPLCAVCASVVIDKRRTYCTPACSKQAMRVGIMTLRELVWHRDKGICSKCGLDTPALIDRLIKEGACPSFYKKNRSAITGAELKREFAVRHQLEQWKASLNRYDLWDMNHKVAVELFPLATREAAKAQGKTLAELRFEISEAINDLDNLETLCIPCHKAITRDQAGERAKRKRAKGKIGQKELQLRETRELQCKTGTANKSPWRRQ